MILNLFHPLSLCIAGLLALAGCNLAKDSPAYATVEAGNGHVRLQASPMSPKAAMGALAQDALDNQGAKDSPSPAAPARCNDAEIAKSARRVRADIRIDYGSKTADVVQSTVFHNFENDALAAIVLDVQANQWAEGFTLMDLTVNDEPAAYELDLNRMQINLNAPLESGCWLALGLKFRLQPAEIRDGLRSYRGFYGYSPRQLNLGHFLPTIAARLDGDWRIHEPIGIGEQVVYEAADWHVNLSVENTTGALMLAAPGTVTALGSNAWEIELINSRDFAISVSDQMIAAERQISENQTVEVYSFADAQINANGIRLDGAQHVLIQAEKALRLYERQFGPYDRERFVIVQGDFPDGMEFTGLVFVGGAWFTNFDGGIRNYLTLISVHEIAHQWWYARVGNDSALNPWLDEALATYSEYLFIEEHYPADKNWWWTFRVAGFFPQGKVDSNVYEFATARAYINAVYLRGVQMLHNLRVNTGDEEFFKLLRAYLAAGDGKIADPTLFWRQLPLEQRALTRATRVEYLGDADDDSLFGEAAHGTRSPATTENEKSP
ncbi:MAG: M1 family aminopeptidase [Chloroflexi bacterium]|nr:M1 family aminopeptidase [Chloroflexota bacterium]